MSGLVTFFERHQSLSSDSSLLDLACCAFLKGEEVGKTLLCPVIEKGESLLLKTPEECLDFYRLLTCILFMKKKESSNQWLDKQLEKLIRKGKTGGFWKSFQLEEGHRLLADYLYEGKQGAFEVKQLEKGAILQENEMHTLERQIPHPRENAELALICLYLGWAWRNDELIQSGLKLTEFCLSLCDSNGEIFEGMWVRESEYREKESAQMFSFLFTVASHVAFSPRMQVASKVLSKKTQGLQSPFIALFARAFEKLIQGDKTPCKAREELSAYDYDQSLGFLRYQHKSLNFACSALGANTGLGTIHKKGIRITSFGPHYTSLADSNCYGIFRPSNGSCDGFKDLTIDSGSEKASLKGWTRLINPVTSHIPKRLDSFAQGGKQWLFFDITGEEEKVNLTISRSQCDEKTCLYFVFFISADKGITQGGDEVLPRTLERFQGKSSKVFFEKGGEKLTITPTFEGEMEVIPLAGRNYFWSADFLLAFPLTKKMVAYHWHID